jgi:hypothetical protein
MKNPAATRTTGLRASTGAATPCQQNLSGCQIPRERGRSIGHKAAGVNWVALRPQIRIWFCRSRGGPAAAVSYSSKHDRRRFPYWAPSVGSQHNNLSRHPHFLPSNSVARNSEHGPEAIERGPKEFGVEASEHR